MYFLTYSKRGFLLTIKDESLVNVALFNGSKRFDGITSIMLQYKTALKATGYRVDWYQLMDTENKDDYVTDGVSICGVRTGIETVSMGINRLYHFPRKSKHIKYEIAFVADPTLAKVTTCQRKTIIHIHDLRPLTKYGDKTTTRALFNFLLPTIKKFDIIIVPSSPVREHLVELGFKEDRIRMIHETTHIARNEGHISNSSTRIRKLGEVRALYIAQDRPYKGIGFFLRIAEASQNLGLNIRFCLVSKLRKPTLKLAHKLALDNLTIITHAEDITAVYNNADVFVDPSAYEGFGLPIIESMTFGIPVIANHIQPFNEILAGSGVLLETSDPQKWTEEIMKLIQVNAYISAAKRSYERFDYFSPERFRSRVARVFGELS